MRFTGSLAMMAGGCVGLIALAAPAAASVTFSTLGASSRVNAISADGTTAVGRIGGRATRWVGSVPQDLNTFGNGSFSTANAVSADGSVVVGNAYNGDSWSPDTVAYRWSSGGGASSLGVTGGNYEGWGALGVSGDGSAVVGRSGFGLGATAFGAPFGPPVSTGPSSARGISASGSVIVGQTRNSDGTANVAFRWTTAESASLIGALAGGVNSAANAVSADGSSIVGWSESAAGRQAFAWTLAGGMIGLGDLAGGSYDSEALATSADGSVIVGIGTDALGAAALRWTPSGTTSIQTLLEGAGLNLAGWRLTSATGVSADGLTFVGNGTAPGGQSQGWMATIPAPGIPAAAAMCGLFGCIARHRRDR